MLLSELPSFSFFPILHDCELYYLSPFQITSLCTTGEKSKQKLISRDAFAAVTKKMSQSYCDAFATLTKKGAKVIATCLPL